MLPGLLDHSIRGETRLVKRDKLVHYFASIISE